MHLSRLNKGIIRQCFALCYISTACFIPQDDFFVELLKGFILINNRISLNASRLFTDEDCLASKIINGAAPELSAVLDKYIPFRSSKDKKHVYPLY